MMRYLFLFIFILSFAYGQQVKNFTAYEIFGRSYTTVDATDGWYKLTSTDGAANTYTSDGMSMDGYNSDMDISINVVNVSGSVNFTLEIGLYRGLGNPDNTGVEWHTVATINAEGSTEYNLMAQSYITDQLYTAIYIRITETGNQSNDYILNLNRFKP